MTWRWIPSSRPVSVVSDLLPLRRQAHEEISASNSPLSSMSLWPGLIGLMWKLRILWSGGQILVYLVDGHTGYDDFQSTPTGKVSKAKKGKPVHVCSECQKVYTRAEHLRRHQSSHQEPQFECPVCQRRFHRKDLLERHYKR
ncbi:hypothetical protein HZ326_25255 [Fusarium oxysporum f. sp. albedinis]|nr:hypothetical protein HZ326_25255 [Fusarium oxysporum f. sp. albedinis]